MMQPVLFRKVAQRRQRAEIAIHAEHAIGDEQPALAGGQLADDAPRGVDILVREHLDGGAAQAAAVDDARVVQLVRDDDVVFCQDRRDRSGIGREAALKHDDRLDLLELGEPALELHVDRHRARDRPDRPGSDAERLSRLERRFPQPGMGREAEIIVRRQVDY